MRKLLMIASASLLLLSCSNKKNQESASNGSDTSGTKMESKTPPQSEFADARYTEMGKKMLAQFQNNDVDSWISDYDDNAVYQWSSGDSLAGKKAISDYWKNRRNNVIDSISFSNDIWLPIKVNTPQRGPDAPGIWLLSWYQVNVKYKNGKKLMFWVHADHHFNANDKIDRTIQYIDRAPINKALGK
jgi:hypothetical protein